MSAGLHGSYLNVHHVPTPVGISHEAPSLEQLSLVGREQEALERIVVRIPINVRKNATKMNRKTRGPEYVEIAKHYGKQ